VSAPAFARRRARPVADAPPLDGRELAKAWLLELVAAAPLESVGRVPGPAFAAEAPVLCAAAADALATDATLDELEPGGALAPLARRLPVLAGAVGAAAALAAVEALRAALWLLVVETLHRPDPRLVADLADRIGAVTAALATAAVTGVELTEPPRRPADRGPLAEALLADAKRRDEPERPGAAERPGGPDPHDLGREPHEAGAEPRGDVVVEPRHLGREPHGFEAEPRDFPRDPRDAGPEPRDFPRDPRDGARPVVDDAGSADELLLEVLDPAALRRPPEDPEPIVAPPTGAPRLEDASAPRADRWTEAIGRQLARHATDARPFAVLCLEVAELDRLVQAGPDERLDRALEGAERALLGALRPADAVIREQAGRYWIVAPDTDAVAARGLAELVAAAVGATPGLHGVPLHAAVGLASCPDDGFDATALEARAEEGLYAARAAGLRVVR